MQNLPAGWTPGDLDRFNAVADAANAYQILDYARTRVAPNNAFLQARQTDIGNLVLTLGQFFINQWNT